MFKTQVAAASGFTAKFEHFMVFKSTDHRKLPLISYLQYMEKVRAELALFSIEKAHTLHLMSLLLSVLL